MDGIGMAAVVADPVTHQCAASEAYTCMACAMLSALSLAGISGPDLNERHIAYKIGTIVDVGASLEDALPVLRAYLGGRWLAMPMHEVPVAMAAVGVICIASKPTGGYAGHVVATFGLGDGVRVHDTRQRDPYVCSLDWMAKDFSGRCILITPSLFAEA